MAIRDVPPRLAGNHLYVAARELREGKLPMRIRRPLPGNRYAVVDVADLDAPEDIDVMIEMFASGPP